MNNNSNRHSVLLEQISYWAKKVGRASARPVLLLWFVMTSSNTPKSEKIMLASAIAYVVLPIDLISAKRIPIIGWLDEVVSLTVAYQKVCKYITPDMEIRADAILDHWFMEYTPDIELTDLGHEQAKQLGQYIKNSDLHIDEILASPLMRAKDTAKHISEVTGIPMRIEQRLIEQNFGKYESTARNGEEFGVRLAFFIH